MKPIWSVVIVVVTMFVQVLAAAIPVSLLLDRHSPLREPLAAVGITLASLLLVHLVRRYVDRRPWAALGWHKPSHIMIGVVAGLVPVLVANGISLAVGAVTWVPVDGSFLAWLPLVMVVVLLNQAFPEELLWRGHLVDTLLVRLSPRAVLVISSTVFGALHILSSSDADTVLERVLHMVMAVALGFACTAARLRGGGLWMAVGVHWGLHIGLRVLPIQAVDYGVQVVLQTVMLAVAGAVLLKGRGLLSPTPRTPERAEV
ncbi:CPBP family intramembrane glutamic endopeptidase [Nonomuraea rhodomycinica]|uniref:CPBP family intramembrane metalloprotease n=1 Tax=Nonomuraea rhodomycinica TaxID=1712872 RepID=A0A7Y6MBI5_9ACTN|nr:type II CAAX endopeptidase family protein [Nonomuraea rhodomycinica]NUW40940.1 CPBP family intramembrane metalloprotease [Nonomuraea rhodomycinica]